ncbi:SufB/SufD family protein [Pseudoroseicyclus tamaricis]|uniref:SufD family Fe-S cluster assembly protein n=1 Tax=Pseudoroseicyclus tamaricis TaxID=2705421 RepID=A0A6B2JZZ9_9RHOB|nr:SufD family Fe-S cluster assembly protein [Pseudoroseicyclus tamaricis]NDV00982.1 SufD family Fe-S cluster assembly protein [Pseudoroseicyclus tamaricis]
MALTKPKQEMTDARLAEITLPEGGRWAREAREAALGRLRAMGLPHGRDEYWRFTRPDSLNEATPRPAAVFDAGETEIFSERETIHVTFVDGVFAPEESDTLEGTGLEIVRLAEAMASDIHWAKDVYGKLETRGHDPVDRPFAALNSATATDGVVIRVTGKADRPLRISYQHRNETSDAVLHNLVWLEPGAELTLLENGPAAARFNHVMEVEVADGATFHHVRAQGRDHERRCISHLYARLGEGSTFKSFTLTANGALTRNEAVLWLEGEGGTAHIAGASMGDGGGFHDDDTIFVTHDAEGCESRQVFKKVLRNGATGVFQGKILVKPGAQKTDGYQISQSLLLDGDSQFLAKPELEIYADDVACSHGSTSGAIDETALYYLRSRGIAKEEATDLLTLSFVAEALEEIEDESIAEEIRTRLEGWLARRRG